ncbi:Mss4-like protein [Kalaharituber pfeilii]|nr:Mss4-like protein [Kalaharituber pfeilii]
MSEVHNPITGRCLCEEVRYTVSFPLGTEYPPDVTHTCQCTQCRKNTGALVAHFITVAPSQITWALPRSHPVSASGSPEAAVTSTFREYASSTGCYRGFCEQCGTTLLWRTDRKPKELEIMTGTIDEDCLMEKELCIPTGGQFWCKNFIRGVTDAIPGGEKWVEGTALGQKLESLQGI